MVANDERESDPRREFEPRDRDARARDRNRPARDRDRSRQNERDRSEQRGSTRSNLGTVVRDVDRLAYSLTRAGARAYFGAVGALGDLVVNLADTIYSSPYGVESNDRYRDRDRNRNPDASDPRDEPRDRSGRDPRRSRDSAPGRARSMGSDLSSNVSQAIRDTADVLSDSVREFDQVFHDEQDRDDEVDERVAAAEDDVAQTRQERTRPRTRPSAPPESKDTP